LPECYADGFFNILEESGLYPKIEAHPCRPAKLVYDYSHCSTNLIETLMAIQQIILLVEDDENDVMLLKRAFTKAGFKDNLRVVRNGTDAMSYLSGKGIYKDRDQYPLPFLVLLDLKMPGISGFEVLQWARKDPNLKRLLIVVLTASNLQTDVDHAYELGANSYLVKPIEFDAMVAMVSRFEAYWSELNRIPTAPRTPEVISVGTSVI